LSSCSVIDNKDDNLVVAEGVTDTSRIVDIVVVVTIAASDKDVVVTVVDISNDTVTSINTITNSAIIGVLHALEFAEAQIVRLGPVDEAATCITTIVTKPGIEDTRIATIATISKVHRNRGDGATSRADGIGASTEVIVTPGFTALAVVDEESEKSSSDDVASVSVSERTRPASIFVAV